MWDKICIDCGNKCNGQRCKKCYVAQHVPTEAQRRGLKLGHTIVMVSGILLGLILSPFPGIDAVSISVSNSDISVTSSGTDNTIDLDVVVKDPADITFPDGRNVDHIASNYIIQVIIDKDTSGEKTATFSLTGTELSGNSAISSLTLVGVQKTSGFDGYGSFTYGYGYGYGYGTFYGLSAQPAGYGFGYGTIGNGTYGYGLSANTFSQDTTSKYRLTLDPGLISSGSHTIQINILETTSSNEFFSSGPVSFTNTVSVSSNEAVAPAGEAVTVTESKPVLKIVKMLKRL